MKTRLVAALIGIVILGGGCLPLFGGPFPKTGLDEHDEIFRQNIEKIVEAFSAMDADELAEFFGPSVVVSDRNENGDEMWRQSFSKGGLHAYYTDYFLHVDQVRSMGYTILTFDVSETTGDAVVDTTIDWERRGQQRQLWELDLSKSGGDWYVEGWTRSMNPVLPEAPPSDSPKGDEIDSLVTSTVLAFIYAFVTCYNNIDPEPIGKWVDSEIFWSDRALGGAGVERSGSRSEFVGAIGKWCLDNYAETNTFYYNPGSISIDIHTLSAASAEVYVELGMNGAKVPLTWKFALNKSDDGDWLISMWRAAPAF